MWATPIFFSRMIHGRGVCRLASPRAVAAGVTGSGDVASQLVLEARADVDSRRLLACASLGFVLDGAALQGWFAWLHARVPGEGALVLAEMVQANSSLTGLALAHNSINSRGLCALAHGVAINRSLQSMTLWGNRFDSAACLAWLPALDFIKLDVGVQEVNGAYNVVQSS